MSAQASCASVSNAVAMITPVRTGMGTILLCIEGDSSPEAPRVSARRRPACRSIPRHSRPVQRRSLSPRSAKEKCVNRRKSVLRPLKSGELGGNRGNPQSAKYPVLFLLACTHPIILPRSTRPPPPRPHKGPPSPFFPPRPPNRLPPVANRKLRQRHRKVLPQAQNKKLLLPGR